MLNIWKSKLSDTISKFAGSTKFLEAVCAACALVAASNDIKDEEVEAAIDAVKTNKTLSGAFKAQKIEKAISTALERTKTRPGKLGLFKELEQVTEDQAEIVYLAALDVADADGDIDDVEREMLTKIAGKLSVNESTLDI